MMSSRPPTRILTRADVAALLPLDDCIRVVEMAFRMHGEGRSGETAVLGVHAVGGGFHVKAALLELSQPYFAAKLNANFPGNPSQHGLPTIQGVVALCDGRTGALMALMDSMELTTLRTGAATALAAKHLARADASVVTIVGCGLQGRVSLQAISRVRALGRACVFDADAGHAAQLARDLAGVVTCPIEVVTDLPAATRRSDMIVTCTTSRRPILQLSDVMPGAFVAAVGADNPEKHEIAAELLGASAVVTDVTAQCASIGDLHHALAAGIMTVDRVRAELGQVVAGARPGRLSDDEVIVFDSTGVAFQDVAAAALVYERAVALDRGLPIQLG